MLLEACVYDGFENVLTCSWCDILKSKCNLLIYYDQNHEYSLERQKVNIMKRFLIGLLGIIMILSSVSTSAYDVESISNTNKRASSLSDAEQILFIPGGDDCKNEYGVGYMDDDFVNVAPSSFAVENGVIYVLDTLNGRIITEHEGYKTTIRLSGITRPKHMCVFTDCAYLTDIYADSLYEVNLANGSIKSYDLPKGITANSVYRLYKGGNAYLILLDHNLRSFVFDRETHVWKASGQVSCNAVSGSEYEIKGVTQKPVKLELGYNTLAQFVSGSDDLIVIIAYEYVPGVSVIMFEKTVRVFNSKGELVGCTVAEDDVYAYPEDEIYISDDGSVYMMQCLNKGVFITKPNLRASYDSDMDAITEEAYALCKHSEPDTATRGVPITSLSRPQVIERARSCANYSWTFDPAKNGLRRIYTDSDGNTYQIMLPNDERDVTGCTELTGIPYCRGMHDGPSSFSRKLNQIYTGDGYNTYYTAGNLQSPTCYGSTGLDCSGLACYAYNAPSSSYWTTYSFAQDGNGYDIGTVSSTGTEVKAHFANMKEMDFMVRADSTRKHIVLYVSWESTNYVKIIHASYSRGKVVEELYSFSNLKGFKMKSPYSCAVSGCQNTYTDNNNDNDNDTHTCTCSICGNSFAEEHTYKTAYSRTELYHYHECTKCGHAGNREYHSFINAGTVYRCSVCGYETTHPVVPIILEQ